MTSVFFAGVQQDIKIAFVAPVVCALFRLVFILVYAPVKRPRSEWRKWFHCFRYGFWWGMDFNAYVFLVSFVLVTIPAVFLPAVAAVGDTVRLVGLLLYLAVLYTAFAGKMIFYFHFHDIFNHILFLGKNADKKNFADIFFNQNHGGLILAGYVPFLALWGLAAQWLLRLPALPAPQFAGDVGAGLFNFALFAAAILLFYFFRYGGTLNHRHKPEWDEVPAVVKDDVFFGKAVIDDLVALELLKNRPRHESLRHTDEESMSIFGGVLPAPSAMKAGFNPLLQFRREAAGAKIKKPSHIFLLFGESHSQAAFDPLYENLHIADAGKKFRSREDAVAFNNFLPGGTLSQTSIVSIMSGIFDADMELNENKDFWSGNVPTALASQIKKLGYRTVFWYGGSLTWASLKHYTPATGFDESWGGVDICPADAPRTWLGVYDHIFLSDVARLIKEGDDAPTFHFVYTTSNHGPYNIPVEKYGFDREKCMPDLPPSVLRDEGAFRRLACFWYADKFLMDFAEEMRALYPDSLFIVTGDHASRVLPLECNILARTEPTIRERMCTSFAMSAPGLRGDMFAGNDVGSHMNILPTLMELIAPQGFSYYSLFPALTAPIDHAVTPHCWIDKDMVGLYADKLAQPAAVSPQDPETQHDTARYLEERQAYCELTGYMVRHPELLI